MKIFTLLFVALFFSACSENSPFPPSVTVVINNTSYALNWSAPLTFENEQPVDPDLHLSGYHIYYGSSASGVTDNVTVIDASQQSIITSDIDKDFIANTPEIFIAMISISSTRVKSKLSGVISFKP